MAGSAFVLIATIMWLAGRDDTDGIDDLEETA
jgi:hypothetical protein